MIPKTPAAPDLTRRVLGFRSWTFGYVLDPDAPGPRSRYQRGGGMTTEEVAPTYYLVNGERVPTLFGNGGHHWHAGANRARCRADQYSGGFIYGASLGASPPPPPPHRAPGSQCGCGLYGLHDGEMLVAKGACGASSVLGAIAAWGRMEVHADGFRAEYAQIVMLGYDPAQGIAIEARTRKTAEAFGVPCLPIDDLPAAAL